MTEQKSYNSSTHFANAKVCIITIYGIIYFVTENEQSSEGTEESRNLKNLEIADLATVNALSDVHYLKRTTLGHTHQST